MRAAGEKGDGRAWRQGRLLPQHQRLSPHQCLRSVTNWPGSATRSTLSMNCWRRIDARGHFRRAVTPRFDKAGFRQRENAFEAPHLVLSTHYTARSSYPRMSGEAHRSQSRSPLVSLPSRPSTGTFLASRALGKGVGDFVQAGESVSLDDGFEELR
jgi:hypothetical protein